MQRRFTRLALMLCLSVFFAGVVNAQSAHRFEVEIPFPFVLQGRMLPAGKYLVQRIDPAKPNVLMLINSEARIVRLVQTHRVESEKPGTASVLVFVRREAKLHLFQIWTGGNKNGNEIPSFDERERRDQYGAETSVVRIRAKT